MATVINNNLRYGINAFISELQKNPVIRTNRFGFECYNEKGKPLPMEYSCENIEIPELNINTSEFQINNAPAMLFPYARNLGDNTFTATFREGIVNGVPGIYTFFQEWEERVVVPNINIRDYTISYYDDIMGSAILKIFDLQNDASQILNVQFVKVFPTSVKMSTFDYADQNNIVKTTVKFYFEEMKVQRGDA